MAKTKKNKKGMAEAIAAKKGGIVKLNPFDIRTVRTKQKVLGRKTKNDIGKPGVARAKAIQVVSFVGGGMKSWTSKVFSYFFIYFPLKFSQ